MYQNQPGVPSIDNLPTMYDLPSEDPEESGLPDEFHDFQPDLLRETCRLPAINEYFIGVDLNLYYDTRNTNWYKRPDWFLVLGVPASRTQQSLRLSYVLWQEGVAPFLMVELLSPGTEAEDLGQTLRIVGKPPTKWQVYEQMLRVPYYAVFDRYANHFRMFCLQGTQYVELTITGQGFWFQELELGLGIWKGVYAGVDGQWLRWYDATGDWILTNEEQTISERQKAVVASQGAERERQKAVAASQEADRERQKAVAASQEADRERQRSAALAAKLRELGIDPDEN